MWAERGAVGEARAETAAPPPPPPPLCKQLNNNKQHQTHKGTPAPQRHLSAARDVVEQRVADVRAAVQGGRAPLDRSEDGPASFDVAVVVAELPGAGPGLTAVGHAICQGSERLRQDLVEGWRVSFPVHGRLVRGC